MMDDILKTRLPDLKNAEGEPYFTDNQIAAFKRAYTDLNQNDTLYALVSALQAFPSTLRANEDTHNGTAILSRLKQDFPSVHTTVTEQEQFLANDKTQYGGALPSSNTGWGK